MLLTSWLSGVMINTRKNGGAIWLVEEHFHRSLKWFVWMLHANYLPLRHLFQQLDGVRTGPKWFSGLVGSMWPTCVKMPIAQFKRYNAISLRLASTS